MVVNWALFLLPFLAATIGWFTNYIAVKMLFHPRKPIKIGFITLHGIFPKRQIEIAKSVGSMVANDLLSSKDIEEILATDTNIRAIIDKIEDTLDNYFEVKFPLKFPLLSKFISPNMRSKVKNEMLDEVEHLAPVLIANQVNDLDKIFNVEQIITQKVTHLSTEKLEAIMMSIIEKELTFIEWVGAALGFIIGLIQVILVLSL
tara:strand:- start:1318 stop:1926 length:609 start_codon:yes stop_codon:yes gene_type:complete